VIYNHVILVLKGVSLTVPKGGIVAIAGRQRRRQDDDAEGHFQSAAPSAAKSQRDRSSSKAKRFRALSPMIWCAAAASR
jgi:branched-chain amino acid transport system ATP-binding protein